MVGVKKTFIVQRVNLRSGFGACGLMPQESCSVNSEATAAPCALLMTIADMFRGMLWSLTTVIACDEVVTPTGPENDRNCGTRLIPSDMGVGVGVGDRADADMAARPDASIQTTPMAAQLTNSLSRALSICSANPGSIREEATGARHRCIFASLDKVYRPYSS